MRSMPRKTLLEIARSHTSWRLWVAAMVVGLWLVGGNGAAEASPFTSIRIGDADGFGFGTGAGLQAPNGGPANVDGSGILSAGDFLPDLNRGGVFRRDDMFDYRSTAEHANAGVTGSGFTDLGSSGSHFTDVALAPSLYPQYSAAGQVYTPNGLGQGGANPPAIRSGQWNYYQFTFDFAVNAADIDPTADLYYELVVGDVDSALPWVYTASTGWQTGQQTQDGLIQSMNGTLGFDDVFTASAGGYEGALDVWLATTDILVAADFVELGTTAPVTSPAGAPEPQTWALLGVGLVGMLGYCWRGRRQAASEG